MDTKQIAVSISTLLRREIKFSFSIYLDTPTAALLAPPLATLSLHQMEKERSNRQRASADDKKRRIGRDSYFRERLTCSNPPVCNSVYILHLKNGFSF